MISFIIIGRNEGWKISKCLESVYLTISENSLTKYEVIYVDSKSTDDTIERVKQFDGIKICELYGDINAAISRNVGAMESNGDVLFFIDGDMELIPSFLYFVYSEKDGLINSFVSGNWINYYYDQDDNLLWEKRQYNIDYDIVEKVTGGLFLIKKDIWNKNRGMNTLFKKSQDIDLGLRLAKQGIFLLRKKEIAAKHHTVAYLDKNRMWIDFISGNHLYGRSLLYRKHIYNKYMYYRLLRNDYSILILLFLIMLILITGNYYFVFFYFFIIVIRTKFLINRIIYFTARDISVILGLFLFWPSTNFFIEYECL